MSVIITVLVIKCLVTGRHLTIGLLGTSLSLPAVSASCRHLDLDHHPPGAASSPLLSLHSTLCLSPTLCLSVSPIFDNAVLPVLCLCALSSFQVSMVERSCGNTLLDPYSSLLFDNLNIHICNVVIKICI